MDQAEYQKAYDLLWPEGTVLYQQPITPHDVVAFWDCELVYDQNCGRVMRWRRKAIVCQNEHVVAVTDPLRKLENDAV